MARDLISQSHRWVRRVLVSAVLMALAVGAITTSTAFARSAQVTNGSVRGASAAVASDYSIKLTAVQTNSRAFFTGPNGSPAPGDHFVFQQKLFYDAAQKMPAGKALIDCTFDWTRSTACSANAILNNRGQVVLNGYVGPTAGFTIAITGGTGEFDGVEGTAFVNNAGQTVQTITLHIQP
jgi:hypothetical protein